MSEFKVGDKVRFKRSCSDACPEGKIATVVVLCDSRRVRVRTEDGYESSYVDPRKYLELVYTNPPHKHKDLIIAWANGAEIEVKGRVRWTTPNPPAWLPDCEYRIKPQKSAKDIKIEEIEAKMRKLADELNKLKGE